MGEIAFMDKATGLMDGFINVVTNLGRQGKDAATGSVYTPPVHNLLDLSNMYRSSACARRCLDIPAGDMVKNWRNWEVIQDGGKDSGAAEDLQKAELKLNFKDVVKRAIIAGRKYGGAGVFIGLKDNPDLAQPLDPETVQLDDLEHLTLLTREDLSIEEYEQDPISPRFRKGSLFSINRSGDDRVTEISSVKIHWTRFAWFGGMPTDQKHIEIDDAWDDSQLISLAPYVDAADTAIKTLSHLLTEAGVDIYKFDSVTQYFETEDGAARFSARMAATNNLKSTVNAIILDKEDDYEQKTAEFSGVKEVQDTALHVLAGLADIPITRFLGSSPGGLNATGESDLRNYYDGIKSRQDTELTTALSILDEVLIRSTIAQDPETVDFEWTALYEMTPEQAATTYKLAAEGYAALKNLGLLEPEFFANIVLGALKSTKQFPTLEAELEALGDDMAAIEIVTEPDPLELIAATAEAKSANSPTGNSPSATGRKATPKASKPGAKAVGKKGK